ncbi:MAG: hypothetical protein HY647_06895, partial [Acidobacteria bacterium]|nr:hypothetical protein [Acidobacteriota bacterium]
MSELFNLDPSAEFQGSVQVELSPAADSGVLEAVPAAGWAISTQGSAISSLPAQSPSAEALFLAQPRLEDASGVAFRLLNPAPSSSEARLVFFGANGNRLASTTVSLPPRQVISLDDKLPQNTALVLLRGNAAIVAYQQQVDATGVVQSLGARLIPPVIGGTIPLLAELGGKVIAADARASIGVPLDALTTDTTLNIASLTSSTAPPATIGMMVMAAFRLSPAGLRLRRPATVEFPVLNSAPLPLTTTLQIYDPQARSYRETNIPVRSGLGGTTLLASVTDFPEGPEGTAFVVQVPVPVGGTGGG